MDIVSFINIFEVQAIIRLILTTFLCSIIGHERQEWKKPAGLRTHILVGVSATLVMLLGIYISVKTDTDDIGRIPAQLLSGIGFIGAGTILRDGFKVKGLTTAASLLSVTAIGLCVGIGAYLIAIIATIIVFIVLKYTYVILDGEEKYEQFKFRVYTKELEIVSDKVENVINKEGIIIKSIVTETDYIEIIGYTNGEKATKDLLMNELIELKEVDEVEELKEGIRIEN